MLKKLKKSFFIFFLSFIVVGLLAFGSPATKASADSADNLKKSMTGILGGWTEAFIYPTQQAAKPGWLGKILFPLNIAGGGFKAGVRTGLGVFDFFTFFKGENIINSYPGEEL